MKKPVTLIIAFAMALSLAACGGNEEAETKAEKKVKVVEPAAEEFEYRYDAAYEGVNITAYNGESQAIRIPAELDGDPVVWVSLRDNGNITHIELPDSVIEIAFNNCSSLTNITIPDSVKEIGVGAFSHCSGLTEITIPDGVTSIGFGAFSGCSSLTEITIPDSVTEIDDAAFSYCSSLKEITIPDSVTWIGELAFAECDGLKVTYQGKKYTYANDPGGWWGY